MKGHGRRVGVKGTKRQSQHIPDPFLQLNLLKWNIKNESRQLFADRNLPTFNDIEKNLLAQLQRFSFSFFMLQIINLEYPNIIGA